MSSVITREPGSCTPIRSAEHRAARRRVYDLVRAAQIGSGLTAEAVDELIDDAERHGWDDVVKLGLHLGIVCERHGGGIDAGAYLERLLTRAQGDGDAVMTALGLAVRAQDLSTSAGRAPVDADRDLARATVLLEGFTGTASEAVAAHFECAIACELRDLWELQLHHYEAAERALDWEENGEQRHAVLLYNRAEVEVNWVAALREQGLVAELTVHAEQARRALHAAHVPALPESWREELRIFEDLVDAISPPPGGAPAVTRSADVGYGGYVHLARALTLVDVAQARHEIDQATGAIDPVASSRIYLFALAVAVELEAAAAGRETAGLRWGRELVARRSARRLATLASMESLIGVERMSAEHAQLQQHAYLDDLTGLANRRALARFTEGLAARGSSTVAVALVDLDRFKQINDCFGHAAGDAALARIATILRAEVREQDLVVRLGGDEFLVLLTLADEDAARRRCEAIVEAVQTTDWPSVCPGLTVTASLGLALGTVERFEGVCAAADAALYRAKQAGGARLAA